MCHILDCKEEAVTDCAVKLCGFKFCLEHSQHQHVKCSEINCYALAMSHYKQRAAAYCHRHAKILSKL
jgi:hypothetical protein